MEDDAKVRSSVNVGFVVVVFADEREEACNTDGAGRCGRTTVVVKGVSSSSSLSRLRFVVVSEGSDAERFRRRTFALTDFFLNIFQ